MNYDMSSKAVTTDWRITTSLGVMTLHYNKEECYNKKFKASSTQHTWYSIAIFIIYLDSKNHYGFTGFGIIIDIYLS